MTELLKQAQYSPLSISLMALSLFAVNNGFFDNIEVKEVLQAESELHSFFTTNGIYSKVLDEIENSQKLDDESKKIIEKGLEEFKNTI